MCALTVQWVGHISVSVLFNGQLTQQCTAQWVAHNNMCIVQWAACTGECALAVGSASRVCTVQWAAQAACALCSGQRKQCAVGCSYSSECTVQWAAHTAVHGSVRKQSVHCSAGSVLSSVCTVSFRDCNFKVADLSPIHFRKQSATDGT